MRNIISQDEGGRARWLTLLIALLCSVPCAAQEGARTESSQLEQEEVVIEGWRPSKEKLATEIVPPTDSSVGPRIWYEMAQMSAKCVFRIAPTRVREVIDGAVNSADQRSAQAQLAGRTAGCRPAGLELPSLSFRGALLEEVFRRFVPDLSLTRQQTFDLEVQARFRRRENERNRLRIAADYRYFEIAVCLVRVQPQLAVQLVGSTLGSPAERHIRSALVDRGRTCVGNVRRVMLEGTRFRTYIADAVYRWVIAARDVDTLIPSDAVLRAKR